MIFQAETSVKFPESGGLGFLTLLLFFSSMAVIDCSILGSADIKPSDAQLFSCKLQRSKQFLVDQTGIIWIPEAEKVPIKIPKPSTAKVATPSAEAPVTETAVISPTKLKRHPKIHGYRPTPG
jgi:hypothetical protein